MTSEAVAMSLTVTDMLNNLRALRRRRMQETISTPCDDLKEGLLKFEISTSDGGEYNSNYSLRNILINDTSVYCSARASNVNIILKLVSNTATTATSGNIEAGSSHSTHSTHSTHSVSGDVSGAGNYPFFITHAIAKAPSTGFTSPVKDVLIFISHDYPDINASAKYNDMTFAKYSELVERKHNLKEKWDYTEPAAFLQLGKSNHKVVHEFPFPRSGRYVLVKLIRSDGSGDNIDCQFIGFQGFVGKQSFAFGSII